MGGHCVRGKPLLRTLAIASKGSSSPRGSAGNWFGCMACRFVCHVGGCLHLFHLRCIQVWAGVENSCPQCRLRFRRFGEYSLVSGQRRIGGVTHSSDNRRGRLVAFVPSLLGRRICEVQHRDQVRRATGLYCSELLQKDQHTSSYLRQQ